MLIQGMFIANYCYRLNVLTRLFVSGFQVSMMSETPNHAHIKQEIDTTSCCSPAPSSGTFSNNTQHAFLYNSSPVTAVIKFTFEYQYK